MEIIMLRYRVFGFSDLEGSQISEELLAAYKTAEDAVSAAERSKFATCVIDWETDEVLWKA
jgi:hypothetical protein